MRGPVRNLSAFLFTAWVFAGCGGEEPPRPPAQDSGAPEVEAAAYTDIGVEELRGMMAHDEVLLVNVHIPFEGDIPGTDLSIPFHEVDEYLDQLPQDRNAPIVLYCRSDRMSIEAATTLAELGFTSLYNLDGGFRAWTAAGYPLEMERGDGEG
jgi:rhodanese-related sulfurtransferase